MGTVLTVILAGVLVVVVTGVVTAGDIMHLDINLLDVVFGLWD